MLSKEIPVDEKLRILKTEYRIPADDRMREDVDEMCDLGRGVLEEGLQKGEAGFGMKRSNLTTLCYIERGDEYLLLHRVKKKNDVNHDKWIGVGGHFEDGESPEECLLREVLEETGLTLTKWRFCGIVTFCFTPDETPADETIAAPGASLEAAASAKSNAAVALADDAGVQPSVCEYMHLYTASAYEGELIPCDEGELVWIKKDELEQLPIWEGDRIFLRLLRERDSFFSLKLRYWGDRLTEAVLDGKRLHLPLEDTKAES